jgi:hypothetical protein
MRLPIGDSNSLSRHAWLSNASGHIGLTVPDVRSALTRLEKLGVEVFKPLGVASNETIPVPAGRETIVPGYAQVYKQIAMIRVLFLYSFADYRTPMATLSNWFHRRLRRIRRRPNQLKLSAHYKLRDNFSS